MTGYVGRPHDGGTKTSQPIRYRRQPDRAR